MLTVDPVEFSALTLKEAVPTWKQIREQRERLRPATHKATNGCFVALQKFFGDTPLNRITAGQLRAYQIARKANLIVTEHGETRPWKKPAGNSCINHEMTALAQLLHHCGLWASLALYYAPLWIPAWSPRDVPSEQEEQNLFAAAAGCREAMLAYWVACITHNTSAAGCELRGLKLGNLFFREPVIGTDGIDTNPSEVYIPPEIVKNFNRPRKIPLNPTALWAFRQCYKRALECGSTGPEDYLFPLRLKINKWDPKRPASKSWLRKSWGHLRRATGLPNLNPHDMRHLFITRCFENDQETNTIEAVAGHVNPKMASYYSHQRQRRKYAAVMAIHPAARKQPAHAMWKSRRDGTYS
ncbi:MAG: site-specific integrase [Acidobacteriaceae bacterium]